MRSNGMPSVPVRSTVSTRAVRKGMGVGAMLKSVCMTLMDGMGGVATMATTAADHAQQGHREYPDGPYDE